MYATYNHFTKGNGRSSCFTLEFFYIVCGQDDICHIRFTVDVQYTGSIEHAQSSVSSSAEQPTCPVCLGKLLCIEFQTMSISLAWICIPYLLNFCIIANLREQRF